MQLTCSQQHNADSNLKHNSLLGNASSMWFILAIVFTVAAQVNPKTNVFNNIKQLESDRNN